MPDLYNRFLVLDVDPYSASEMAEIAARVAESHGKTLELEGAMLLAGTCFGTPREVAKRTRELCLVERGFSLGRAEVREAAVHEALDKIPTGIGKPLENGLQDQCLRICLGNRCRLASVRT